MTARDMTADRRRARLEEANGRAPVDDRIHDAIRLAIADRRLPPGTKLTEQGLAQVFGVGRSRIRDVLARLAHEKVVVIERNRGASVATPTAADAREVFQARKLVEDAIVRQLATVIDAPATAALRAHVEEERAAHERRDRHAAIRLSGAFHLRLAELAGNRTLADILRDLVSRSSLIIAVYERPGWADCSHDDHVALIEALRKGEPDSASRAMLRHLDDIAASLDLRDRPRGTVDLAAVFR